MASRYLVIEFDDEAAAQALCERIDTATAAGKPYRVLGLFAKPGKLCQCFIDSKDYKDWPRTRGAKYGWWVCGVCKRPFTTSHQLRNLLGVERWRSPNTTTGRGIHSTAAPFNSTPMEYTFSLPELSITVIPDKPMSRRGI